MTPSASLTSIIRPAWSFTVNVVSAVIFITLLAPSCIKPLLDTIGPEKVD